MNDIREPPLPGPEVGKLITELMFAVAKRQAGLELAEQGQIPEISFNLSGEKSTAFWNFQHATVLIEQGCEAMQKEIPALAGGWKTN